MRGNRFQYSAFRLPRLFQRDKKHDTRALSWEKLGLIFIAVFEAAWAQRE